MLSYVRSCALAFGLAITQPALAYPDQNQRESVASPCNEWQAAFDRLTDAERDLLTKHGVLLRERWIISPDLVSDCAQRVRIGDFIQAALAGEVGATQRNFANHNRVELSRVLKKIWPELGRSPGVLADGAVNQEKWGILKYAGLPEPELSDLLRQSLSAEGVSGGFVDFVLSRPIRSIEGDLERIVQREENASTRRDRTSTTEIYCLAVLHSLGQRDIAKRLTRLSGSDRTTGIEKTVISTILSRIRAKERIRWQDLEALESQA